MSKNNKVELNGFLGSDPKKMLSKEGKIFIVLNVATTDSYPVANEKTGEITWKDKETVWHTVFVFRSTTIQFAKELKKGDKIEITGTLSYKIFKDEKGINRRQAAITASYIEKIVYEKQEELDLDDCDDDFFIAEIEKHGDKIVFKQ